MKRMSGQSRSLFGPDRSFWRGRRVFLTGHTGFKGAWLTLWLSELGAETYGYALPAETPSAFGALGLSKLCEHQESDICDLDALSRAVRRFAPEIVIHMAAQPLVRRSYVEPLQTIAVNVQGTANLLDACRNVSGLKAIVSVTTDKCYLNREWPWSYRENDPLGGEDPYSASKACAEIVTSAWRSSFFPSSSYDGHNVAIATARAGNVFGGGDWSQDRLIPDCVRAFSSNSPVMLRSPKAVRPWQYVLEPLLGYLMLARALVEYGPKYGRAWNFGPRDNQLLTVADVAAAFSAAWGDPAQVEHQPQREAPHEAEMLLLDSGLANRELNWTPQLTTAETFAATARWYKAAVSNQDLLPLSRNQISSLVANQLSP
jgi:CDP-glucose 4,6-dehydratase